MNKHTFDHKCPKCTGIQMNKIRFCDGGCWDGATPGSDGSEHLHWECNCSYEWLTLCADRPATDARF